MKKEQQFFTRYAKNSRNFRSCAPGPPKKVYSALQTTQLLIDSTLQDQNWRYKVQILSGIFSLFSGKTCTAPLKICGPFAYVYTKPPIFLKWTSRFGYIGMPNVIWGLLSSTLDWPSFYKV
jgi:hypothetical protein